MDIINIIMIIWIASYPKSGNTWVRSFLTNYFSNDNDFSFKQLNKIKKFPNKDLFNELNIDYSNFNNVPSSWILMQEYINLKNEIVYFKTHNAMATINNNKFTDSNNTIGFIYLVRDPRDVVLSYASHLGNSVDDTFDLMQDNFSFELDADNIEARSVLLGSWAANYNSWKSFNSVEGLIIRYEDLVMKPKNSFLKIIEYLHKISGLNINLQKIDKCISNTRFDKLQNLEITKGFKEKGVNSFFRKGIVGDWKENLDPKIIKKIEVKFIKEMKELGYL